MMINLYTHKKITAVINIWVFFSFMSDPKDSIINMEKKYLDKCAKFHRVSVKVM